MKMRKWWRIASVEQRQAVADYGGLTYKTLNRVCYGQKTRYQKALRISQRITQLCSVYVDPLELVDAEGLEL